MEHSSSTPVADTSYDPPLAPVKHSQHRRPCLVCGAKASGINFNILTCISCKAFFRRNGVRSPAHFVCRYSGQCVITEKNRRQCTACRIRRCFAIGMVKDRIRTAEENQNYRALVEENRRERLEKSQQQHQGYELKIVAQCRHDSLCSKVNLPITHVNALHKMFLKTSKEIVPDTFILQFDADLANVLNLHCIPICCLIGFVKQLAHFKSLGVDDKIILMKNNTRCLQPLLIYLFNHIFNVPILVQHPGQDHINNAFATSYTLLTNSIARDSKLVLLCMSTLLFCPSLLTVNASNAMGCMSDASYQFVRYAFDEYGQILWQYLVKQSEHRQDQAIISYMKLISVFLRLQQLTSEIYDRVPFLVQADGLQQIIRSLLYLL